MRYLIFIVFTLIVSCSSYKPELYKGKYDPTQCDQVPNLCVKSDTIY